MDLAAKKEARTERMKAKREAIRGEDTSSSTEEVK